MFSTSRRMGIWLASGIDLVVATSKNTEQEDCPRTFQLVLAVTRVRSALTSLYHAHTRDLPNLFITFVSVLDLFLVGMYAAAVRTVGLFILFFFFRILNL